MRGRVTIPEGTEPGEIRITLVPESTKTGRRSVKLNKKGEFFFGLVPDGQYTLAVEGTPLVTRSITLKVFDTESRKDIVNYDGPAPAQPQVFDLQGSLKVTYDIVLGAARPAPEAPTAVSAAGEAVQRVPSLLQEGDYQGALSRLDEALKSSPEDPSLHYYRGFALFKTKAYDKATTEIQRALELDPNQLGAHWVNGAILASQGKKQQAVAEFQKELENPQTDLPTRINSYINIGLIHRDLEKDDEAIAAFEKVIELDAAQAEAYSYLADLYLDEGKLDKAAEVQAKSRALGLEDAKDAFNLGANYWNKKDIPKAEEYFKRAVELDPKFALAWRHLGDALIGLGKTAEAAQALRTYLELSPQATDTKDVQQILQEIEKK